MYPGGAPAGADARSHPAAAGFPGASTAVARTPLDLAQLIPPQIASLAMLRAGTGLMFSSGASAPVNTVITNVAGSRVPLYLGGVELVGCAGFGPITGSVGLFHAVMSTGDSISIAINACRNMLPGPGFYAECLQLSYDELRDAATARPIGGNKALQLYLHKHLLCIIISG